MYPAVEEQNNAERGAAAALERVCLLESRLRQALQNSGSLRTVFHQDKNKDDREIIALQNVQYVRVPASHACLFRSCIA